MSTVSQFYAIGKSQAELDFVDVQLRRDNRLFVDPFAISQRPDPWSQEAHSIIVRFFQRVVDDIRRGNTDAALEALSYLREPNETRFGLSAGEPHGAGIGDMQAEDLLNALVQSSAVKTGSLNSLEECELMIEGIGHDKISDLATNLIRIKLADYTKTQCVLHSIPTQQVPLPPYYDETTHTWISDYFDLPAPDGRPLLLVPKLIARYKFSYNHQIYYQHFVLNFLQSEHLSASSALVRTLKNGKRRVYKKDLKETFPCTKENLAAISRDHPELLESYREYLAKIEYQNSNILSEEASERALAQALMDKLTDIPSGSQDAYSYHNLMTGILEFLFYPHLITPVKEREIHDGRKRIDIVMNNAAMSGIFHLLHSVRRIFCPHVFIECKNYTNEIANPELDQLSGRFGTNRGLFGILCCRHFEDRDLFVKRCRDTHRDGRGLIIGLSDDQILEFLRLITLGSRNLLDAWLMSYIDEVTCS
ncbi:MAG: hypothetical protein WCD79_10720 [Chthoniobacteraceae bacterium]